jgi:hypothetical protein
LLNGKGNVNFNIWKILIKNVDVESSDGRISDIYTNRQSVLRPKMFGKEADDCFGFGATEGRR